MYAASNCLAIYHCCNFRTVYDIIVEENKIKDMYNTFEINTSHQSSVTCHLPPVKTRPL